jgi:ubiquitin-protein ligase
LESSHETYTTAPEELPSSESVISENTELPLTMASNSNPTVSDVPQNKRIMTNLIGRIQSTTDSSQVKPIDTSLVGLGIACIRQHDIGYVPNGYPANLLKRSLIQANVANPVRRGQANTSSVPLRSPSMVTSPSKTSILYEKRIYQELRDTSRLLADYVHVQPIGDSLRVFLGSMEGPPGSPYEDGMFHVVFVLPRTYPMKPPHCRFITKIYHPNIDLRGKICLDILTDHWGPSMTLNGILISIVSILDDPGIEEPLVPEIAELFLRDKVLYQHNARSYTERYAISFPTLEMIDNCLLDMAQFTEVTDLNGSALAINTTPRPQALASLFNVVREDSRLAADWA